METFEIRYFLAAAQTENLQTAAKVLAVSAPAISRAVSRLEEELGVKLFKRVGRNIKLSGEGQEFQREASRIIEQHDAIKSYFRPSKNALPISIVGTEYGLSALLPEIIERLKRLKITYTLDIKVMPDSKRVERAVLDGEAHLGVISGNIYTKALSKISLGKVESKTLVGPGHPLYKLAKEKKPIGIEKVLNHEFVSFEDGWRDDKFKRRIGLKTASVEIAIRAIETGFYLGYLPPILAITRNLLSLAIEDCPYMCKTETYLVAKNPKEVSWMSRLFD